MLMSPAPILKVASPSAPSGPSHLPRLIIGKYNMPSFHHEISTQRVPNAIDRLMIVAATDDKERSESRFAQSGSISLGSHSRDHLSFVQAGLFND